MGRAYGLQTHIWNNNLKSTLLLAGFPVLLIALTYGLFLIYAGLTGQTAAPDFGYGGGDPFGKSGGSGGGGLAGPFLWAAQALAASWPFALLGAGIWFVIAYFGYQAMIDASTGAHSVTRREEPELYNLLENLCISRGITMPTLRIMETDALNAFASGLHEGNYTITVTRGIMQRLNRDELEAVLGHELTHIRNRDVRLLVISVIFVGIFSFVGEIVFRGLTHGLAFGAGRSSSRRENGGGGAAILAIIVGLVIVAVSYALAIVIRFALSRRREYLADAGAVELTKNPDAMISALRKISQHAEVPEAPSEVREMFIENPHAGFADFFATHPPIEKRIEALVAYAGGLDIPLSPPETPADHAPTEPHRPGPWG